MSDAEPSQTRHRKQIPGEAVPCSHTCTSQQVQYISKPPPVCTKAWAMSRGIREEKCTQRGNYNTRGVFEPHQQHQELQYYVHERTPVFRQSVTSQYQQQDIILLSEHHVRQHHSRPKPEPRCSRSQIQTPRFQLRSNKQKPEKLKKTGLPH